MQKQKKQMIFVAVLLLLFAAAYGGMRVYNDKQEEKERAGEEADKIYVTESDADAVTAFSYQNGGETLSFVLEDDTWVCRNDDTVKLDAESIENIVSRVCRLEAEAVVEPEEELSEYGFDAPENVITVTTKAGTETLTVGMKNPVTGQYYLRKDEGETLYLVASDFPSAFTKALTDLEDAGEETAGTE